MKTNNDAEIIKWYLERKSTRLIRDHFQISQQTLYNILERNNVEINRVGFGSVKIPKEEYTKIIKLYEDGLSTETIGKIYNVNHDTIGRLLGILGIDRRQRQYEINENFFEKINTPEKAYVFGLMIADGCVDNNRKSAKLDLKTSDEYILNYVKNNIYTDPNKPIMRYKNDMSRLNIDSIKIVSDLIKLGCIPRKTYNYASIHIPKGDLFWDFLRGLFDGDGCFSVIVANTKTSTKRQYFQLCLNKNFGKVLCEELINKGYSAHIYDHPTSECASYIYITKIDELIKLYDDIYYNGLPSMNRKKDKWKNRIAEILDARNKNI